MRNRARLVAPTLLILALTSLACQQAPPVVNVQAPPCECACAFKASAPQVGKGCWVSGDLMVCPLVRRDLEIEPAYPSEDPRCERLANGDRTATCGARSTRAIRCLRAQRPRQLRSGPPSSSRRR
jgi:hypothetical protein